MAWLGTSVVVDCGYGSHVFAGTGVDAGTDARRLILVLFVLSPMSLGGFSRC